MTTISENISKLITTTLDNIATAVAEETATTLNIREELKRAAGEIEEKWLVLPALTSIEELTSGEHKLSPRAARLFCSTMTCARVILQHDREGLARIDRPKIDFWSLHQLCRALPSKDNAEQRQRAWQALLAEPRTPGVVLGRAFQLTTTSALRLVRLHEFLTRHGIAIDPSASLRGVVETFKAIARTEIPLKPSPVASP